MVIVILCYPLLLAKVKEYAVTIAIHNCNCHCCYLGLSCKRALGTNATKCSLGLNCYWLGWKSRRYLYIDNGMQLCLSYFLPLHAPPSGGTAGYRGATVLGCMVWNCMCPKPCRYIPTHSRDDCGPGVSSIDGTCSRPDPLLQLDPDNYVQYIYTWPIRYCTNYIMQLYIILYNLSVTAIY